MTCVCGFHGQNPMIYIIGPCFFLCAEKYALESKVQTTFVYLETGSYRPREQLLWVDRWKTPSYPVILRIFWIRQSQHWAYPGQSPEKEALRRRTSSSNIPLPPHSIPPRPQTSGPAPRRGRSPSSRRGSSRTRSLLGHGMRPLINGPLGGL